MYKKKSDEEKKALAYKKRIINPENIQNDKNKDLISRLSKIAGQIEGVKRMIDDERYFMEIVIQIRAIRSSLKSIENNLLKPIILDLFDKSTLSTEEIENKLEEFRILLNDKC